MKAQPRISIEHDEQDTVREIVLDGLRRYNRRHSEAPDFQPLTLAARDDRSEVVGGLTGETGWRWLHVDLLWVADASRGQGIGRALLRAAEAEALRRGCTFAYLDTLEFQARRFYEHEGYSSFGVQEDYPPGSRRYFLRKVLTPADSSTT